jgi:hypothetical protein
MVVGNRLFAVLASVAACIQPGCLVAQELRSINQLPGLVDQDQASKVILSNIGTTALNISYLDGDWKTIQIPSGQYVSLPSQSTGVSVSYHDGSAAQTVTLNRGTNYALHWNSAASRWAIEPYDNVARRPSGFRAR